MIHWSSFLMGLAAGALGLVTIQFLVKQTKIYLDALLSFDDFAQSIRFDEGRVDMTGFKSKPVKKPQVTAETPQHYAIKSPKSA